MIIRNYSAQDKRACLEIFISNVPKFFNENELGEFDTFLEGDTSTYLVAEVDGQALGCGGYYVRNGVGRLTWGMVHKNKHHHGIGGMLLIARLNRLFTEFGVETVSFDTSQYSAGFFERFGFVTGTIVKNGFAEGLHKYPMSLSKIIFLEQKRQR